MPNRKIEDPFFLRVKVNNRIFLYHPVTCQIIGYDKNLLNEGFKSVKGVDFEYFEKKVTLNAFNQVYRIDGTYAEYHGFTFKVIKDYDEERRVLTLAPFGDDFETLCTVFDIKPFGDQYMGLCYELEVQDTDVFDLWEIHKPVDGFSFLGPEKVYIKKDGRWLERYVYGSLI